MNLSARVYLDLLVAADYPEQEPAWRLAKNTDLAWFFIPIVGVLIFIQVIESRQLKVDQPVKE